MAAVPAQSLRVADIKDPAELFERYGADEIRLVERKVREQIEQKKEELRYMVGERYRDLIEAADTIGEMRGCSEKVVQSIRDMQNYCSKLKETKNTALLNTAQTEKHDSQEKFYSMAAQIKLLLEMPERMWSALEGSHYLQATQLYLLCAHLHRLLQLDTPTASYAPVLSRFPILIQQVAAAGHFRWTILMESRSVLRERAVSDQAITEALVSTMLLEDSSPRQALAHFLLARTSSIQHLLQQPQHGSGIKAQICSLVELLVTTMYQAHAVFYLPPEGRATEPGAGPGHGLLFSMLENVTSGRGRKVLEGEELSAGSWFRFLPGSVVEFRPVLRTLAQPIPRETLRDTLQSWIHTCEEDMRSGVCSLLVCVRSARALASIRDAIFNLLSSDTHTQYWSSVSHTLLERELKLWDHLLHPLFHQRLQVMIQEGMDQISSSCEELLSSMLGDLEGETSSRGSRFESDVSVFLWTESQSDLPPDAAWVGMSQRGPRPESGLSMKSHALTPRVQSFCSAIDSRLQALLEDLAHFLPTSDSSRHDDGAAVEAVLSECCHACITQILRSIRGELQAASAGGSASVLFLARLCQSLPELCPSLKRCILGRQGETMTMASPRIQGRKMQKGGVSKGVELSPAQAVWGRVREEFLACSMEAYRIWSTGVSQALVSSFGSSLCVDTPGSILITATQWEELEIQEEAESGNTVTSKIRLPVQPSWYVQTLLFHLCREVNRVGGHALPRPTLSQLLRSVLDQVIAEYQTLTECAQKKEAPPVCQNRALQLLFDLRYVSTALRSEDKSSHTHLQSRIQQVCDDLESFVDPFDLDVFTPHLNANLNRLTQRTSVLLGLLTGVEKNFSSRSSSVSSQETYNILPLSTSQTRFGLLPLSMTSSRKTKTTTSSSSSSSSQAVPSSSDQVTGDAFQPGNRFRQLANHVEEPTGPSLFRLGWLSSMAK